MSLPMLSSGGRTGFLVGWGGTTWWPAAGVSPWQTCSHTHKKQTLNQMRQVTNGMSFTGFGRVRFTCRWPRSGSAGSEWDRARSKESCWGSSSTSSAPWEVKEGLKREGNKRFTSSISRQLIWIFFFFAFTYDKINLTKKKNIIKAHRRHHQQVVMSVKNSR